MAGTGTTICTTAPTVGNPRFQAGPGQIRFQRAAHPTHARPHKISYKNAGAIATSGRAQIAAQSATRKMGVRRSTRAPEKNKKKVVSLRAGERHIRLRPEPRLPPAKKFLYEEWEPAPTQTSQKPPSRAAFSIYLNNPKSSTKFSIFCISFYHLEHQPR